MSETVLVNVMVEIIKKINETQTTLKNASLVLTDENLKEELNKIYDELGSIAEKVISILSR